MRLPCAGQEALSTDEALELSGVTLTDADIAEMKKISGLERLSLNNVTFETDGLNWVAQFPQLTGFTFSGYLEELDLTPFAGLTELTHLSFWTDTNARTPVYDLSPLAGLTKLERLSLAVDYKGTNLDALAGMTRLTSLGLIANDSNITTLEPLSGMTKLESFDLSVNRVDTGLAGLEGLTSLTEAQLFLNWMEDDVPAVSLEPVSSWKKLASLNIQANIENQDLTPLSGLTELRTLELHTRTSDPPIRSLEPLRGLEKLQSLSISHVAKGIDQSPVEHVPSAEVW